MDSLIVNFIFAPGLYQQSADLTSLKERRYDRMWKPFSPKILYCPCDVILEGS
mgnify:CR=1 FL=1